MPRASCWPVLDERHIAKALTLPDQYLIGSPGTDFRSSFLRPAVLDNILPFIRGIAQARLLSACVGKEARIFQRVLIANRGEIALRVMRACREMGIESVAVYSDADRRSLHVHRADLAEYIGAAAASDSYLNIANILDAARRSRAQAIHPGSGFLSENAGFPRSCREVGLVFVGPPPVFWTTLAICSR